MQKKNAKNAVVATKVVPANEEIATVNPTANEVTETVETPKAEKPAKVALTEKEKNAIKAAKASKIVSFCALPGSTVVNFLKEGFTVYPSNEAGQIAVKKAIAGVDKLSIKEGGEVQYFFYKNPLSTATLTEIFGADAIPATQKFSTGGANYNPFIRVPVEKVPQLLAASLSTNYAAALFASVEEGKKKATAKAEKAAAKAESITEEVTKEA